MIQFVKRMAKKKSVISAFSIVAVTGTIIGMQLNKAPEPTKYVLATVTRTSLVTSVTASGQVSAENQLDVTPSVSGAILRKFVSLGDIVTTNQPLFEIDRKTATKAVRDAQQNVRDAEISLESAQISYERLLNPKTALALLQAQDALNQAERNLAKLQEGPDQLEIMGAEAKVRSAEQNAKMAADGKTPETVRDAYDKNVITLKNLVLVLQKALDDSDDILGIDGVSANINFTNLFSVLDQGKKIQANITYALAKTVVEVTRKAVDPLELRDENIGQIDEATILVNDALETTATLLENVKKGLEASLTSSSFSQSSLEAYKSTIQSNVNSVTNAYGTMSSMADSIESAQEAYDSALSSLAQAKAELTKLLAGPDARDIEAALETIEERKQALRDAGAGVEDIDIKSSLNTIAQRKSSLQNAHDGLQDAIETLNDYTVRAPFDGVIAKIDAKNASQATPSTVLATLLTEAKIAEVSLNEVDVSKIAVGQKATLTFDAVQDLTIAGTVSEVDLIGTVTQGVVTYNVKIAFLTEDGRIKSGMSVSASIVTDIRTDALVVPNAAVRRSGAGTSVDTIEGVELSPESMSTGVASDKEPQAKPITTGLSNDQYTEITEGLKEGDIIVVRTVLPSVAGAQTATGGTGQGSALRIPGTGSFGGTGGTGGATFRAVR